MGKRDSNGFFSTLKACTVSHISNKTNHSTLAGKLLGLCGSLKLLTRHAGTGYGTRDTTAYYAIAYNVHIMCILVVTLLGSGY
jgi:hypothetical protein